MRFELHERKAWEGRTSRPAVRGAHAHSPIEGRQRRLRGRKEEEGVKFSCILSGEYTAFTLLLRCLPTALFLFTLLVFNTPHILSVELSCGSYISCQY